jgi:hypothetical protein
MFIDGQLLFDDDTEHLTTEAGTNVIDLGGAEDLGYGEPLWFVAIVTTAFTDGSSNSTMALTLETDTADTFGSATTVQTLGTFAALSAVGTRIVARVQPFATPERYLRLKYTVANGDLTTGKFTAFITKDVQNATVYPDSITIS